MQGLRDLLREQLGRSLGSLPDRDRLDAAWPVACGSAMAARGHIVAFDDGVLRVEVHSELWLDQFRQLAPVLRAELARIAAVPIGGIHFEGAAGQTGSKAGSRGSRAR